MVEVEGCEGGVWGRDVREEPGGGVRERREREARERGV